jgi:hypothetical protein
MHGSRHNGRRVSQVNVSFLFHSLIQLLAPLSELLPDGLGLHSASMIAQLLYIFSILSPVGSNCPSLFLLGWLATIQVAVDSHHFGHKSQGHLGLDFHNIFPQQENCTSHLAGQSNGILGIV